MNYLYVIKVEYVCAKKRIIKEYRKDFLEIGKLFVYLETKHKDNYTLISIKSLR